ncbi:hypothetical protein AGMMS50229_14820 [Campylobacterota bacterium]|nr:hypothetical protein AGMMS50229_14820 [Campylobacterota bacterium]
MAHANNDDALLEIGFRIERWVKRNRLFLGAAAFVLVALIAGYFINDYAETKRIEAANEALLALQTDPNSGEALASLQAKSPELYELFALREACKNGDTAALAELAKKRTIAADIAAYELASLSAQSADLARFASRETSLLKELASFTEAYLLLQKGEFETAKTLLGGIPDSSELKNSATSLSHYGIVGR